MGIGRLIRERVANIKQPLALLTMALLGVSLAACGGSGGVAHPHTSTNSGSTHNASAAQGVAEAPLAHIAPDRDRDSDVGAPSDDRRNIVVSSFGHPANTSERGAIVALIERYYAAALAERGGAACSMMYSTLAESIVEDFSGNPGVSYMQGAKTCAAAMTLLFKHYHPLLVLESPRVRVLDVHREGRRGLAQLSFGSTLPERYTSVSLERHTWRMTSLLDSQLP